MTSDNKWLFKLIPAPNVSNGQSYAGIYGFMSRTGVPMIHLKIYDLAKDMLDCILYRTYTSLMNLNNITYHQPYQYHRNTQSFHQLYQFRPMIDLSGMVCVVISSRKRLPYCHLNEVVPLSTWHVIHFYESGK